MSERAVNQSDTASLDRLTLALVVSGLGVCTDETVSDLRRYVESNTDHAYREGFRCIPGACETALCPRRRSLVSL